MSDNPWIIGEVEQALRLRLAAVERDRDALRADLARVMPRCMGRWVKGSGGHRIYAHDCAAPGRWNVGMGWVCDEHKSPHVGDADAWTVESELDILRDAVERDGRESRIERVLMANAERDAAVQRAERAEADRLAEVEGLTAERDHYRAAVHAAEAATAARIAAFIEDGGPEWVTDDLLFALRAGAWRGKEAP